MKKMMHTTYALILMLVDICAYFAALFIAYYIRKLMDVFLPITTLQFDFFHFASLWWILATVLFFMIIKGLYFNRQPLWIEAGEIIKALFFAFAITMALISLGKMSDEVSRLFLCLLWVVLPFFLVTFRIIAKKIIFKSDFFLEKALLIGDEARLSYVEKAFSSEAYMGIKITDQLSEKISVEESDKKINWSKFDLAIIVSKDSFSDDFSLFNHIHKRINKILFVPGTAALSLTNSSTGQLLKYQLGYMTVNNALASKLNRAIKRFSDIVVALIMIPFIIPVILVLMLIVRLTSPGKAIFSHERVGRNGKIFRVYKLRTMYKDAKERLEEMLANDPKIREEWYSSYKLKDDPRVTPFGNFLRKSSLDELPQFFNVLIGNMSFVGPRPVLKEELAKYYRENTAYYIMAKPGITGLWQVSGRSDTSYDDRVAMDCWYVFNWSLWLDLVILFLTPIVVIFRRGAY